MKGSVEVRFRCDSMDLAGEVLQDLGCFLKVCWLFQPHTLCELH